MQVTNNIEALPIFKHPSVTIGTFDGVHLGHRLIIEQLKSEAAAIGGESVIITFDPHPRNVVQGGREPVPLITTLAEKTELLEALGVDHLVVVPFTEAFATQSAESYVTDFLVKNFHPACLVIGYDHRFGKGREGNYELLEVLKNTHQYKLVEIPQKVLQQSAISSTKIRQAIKAGEMTAANELLGYAYFFEGKVVQGDQRGRTLGYPTANLEINEAQKLLPGSGVYAVRLFFDSHHEVIVRKGMMNIGTRPTVDGFRRTIEVHVFDFDENLYGKTMRVCCLTRLRDEKKFDGLDALKVQLAKDEQAARQWLERI